MCQDYLASGHFPWYKISMPTLVILQGPDPGRQFSLDHATAVIGRQPDTAVYLESLAVSRQHAQIISQNGECFVEDLGSSNGTFVNGQRIRSQAVLHSGDELGIDVFHFVVDLDPRESIEWGTRADVDPHTTTCRLRDRPSLTPPPPETPS